MNIPTVLARSESVFARRACRIGDLPADERFEVMLRLRARHQRHGRSGEIHAPPVLSASQLAALYGARDEDVTAVVRFADEADFDLVNARPDRRAIVLRASAQAVARAFGARPGIFKCGGETCRSYAGPVHLPPAIATIVQAVIGLEDARAARTCFIRGRADAPALTALTPATLASVYNFPPAFDGRRQRISVIGFSDALAEDELAGYARVWGGPAPCIETVQVCEPAASDEAANDRAGLLAMLQVLSALASGARLTAYLTAPSESGCIEALLAAVHASETPDILCLGWGAAEEHWTAPALQVIDDILWEAAALGVTVCVAAGDSGAGLERDSDLAAVQLPGASPYALACGGTTLFLGPAGWCERVWNEGSEGAAGGGGVSAIFGIPSWQTTCHPPLSVRTLQRGRGVPDVAAYAAREPGLLCQIDGRWAACGGTAFSAAIWTALLARVRQVIAETADAPLGLVAPTLYRLAHPWLFNRPAIGGNETTGRVGGYFARLGWDACTGLGTPNGAALLDAILYDADQGPGPRADAEIALDWIRLPGSIQDVVEGRDGMLWALGASEIAGQRPLLYSTPYGWAALPGVFGRALAVGHDGAPWLADPEGFIQFFDGGGWRIHPGRVASLVVATDGAPWIVARTEDGGDGAVCRWMGSGFDDSGIAAQRIKMDAAGVLLAVAANGDGFCWTGSAWRCVARNVATLAVDGAGGMWAASRSAGRIWQLDAPDAVWRAATACVATRLLGRKNGDLLAIQASGAIFSCRVGGASGGGRAA